MATGSSFGEGKRKAEPSYMVQKPGKRLSVWMCGLPCNGTVKFLKNPKRVNFAKYSCFAQSPDSEICLFWLLLGLIFRLFFSCHLQFNLP